MADDTSLDVFSPRQQRLIPRAALEADLRAVKGAAEADGNARHDPTQPRALGHHGGPPSTTTSPPVIPGGKETNAASPAN